MTNLIFIDYRTGEVMDRRFSAGLKWVYTWRVDTGGIMSGSRYREYDSSTLVII